jgi:hypothetical protein
MLLPQQSANCLSYRPYGQKTRRAHESVIMNGLHEERQRLGTSAGVRHWIGESGLLLQNEYLAAENRILRAHLPSRLRLSDPERSTLAEIGKRLGRKALKDVACVAKPDTILAWYRRLVAKKFDGGPNFAPTPVGLGSAARSRI